jgi:hypothetical protein
MNDRQKRIILLLVFFCSFCFQLKTITFGLPGIVAFSGNPVPFWFNDEIKEIEHIKSYLEPRATFLHFNYPPLQYLLVSAALYPKRLLDGAMPPDWILALTSRVISALSIALSSSLISAIGFQFSIATGLFAAAFATVSPIMIMTAKDTKSIALGGMFLLLAIYYSFKTLHTTESRKTYHKFIGASLACSTLCSHLALGYLHLPIIACCFSNKVKTGHFFSPSSDKTISYRERNFTIPLCISAFMFLTLLSAFLLLRYNQPLIFSILRSIYEHQVHSQPFESHLTLITLYYAQFEHFILFALFACTLFSLYIPARLYLASTKWLADLPYIETTYTTYFLTLSTILFLASALNPLVPVSLLRFLNSAMSFNKANAGYYGLYPGELHAESFLFSIFPSSLGLPLLLLALIATIFLPFLQAKPTRLTYCFLTLVFMPFFLQILLWNSTFRASRFAFTFFFFCYIVAATFLSELIIHRYKLVRTLSLVLFLFVTLYSFFMGMAFLQTRIYSNDARVRTVQYIQTNIPPQSTIGTRLAAELPSNLGPIDLLHSYLYRTYDSYPDYCVMDGFEHFVIDQYFSRTKEGYTYTSSDWWPSERPPNDVDFAIYKNILNSKDYQLVTVITSAPTSFAGISFDINLLYDPAESLHRVIYIYKHTN